ncbi:MAG: prepilin-type N-terminal cleavage/methylation domain-containing protein [Rhodospirillales bacterium]|nr:prepilin-type N-terminal cleavage/methylation domain-containing protein [Rhodospirillales bacterium]
MRQRKQRAKEAGFTLLEVLVAFAVLAVLIVPILQVFGGGMGSTRTARTVAMATLLARSKLAEVAAARPLAVGEAEGTFEDAGFRWRASIVTDDSVLDTIDGEAAATNGRDGGETAKKRSHQTRANTQRNSSGFTGTRSSTNRKGALSAGDETGEEDLGGAQGSDLVVLRISVSVDWGNRGNGVTLTTFRLESAGDPAARGLE